jgi:glycine C-acetyltransferase
MSQASSKSESKSEASARRIAPARPETAAAAGRAAANAAATPSLDEAAAAELAAIRDAGLSRSLREVESCQEPTVVIDGREFVLLCSNNYLGLASHPEVTAAAREAIGNAGASAVSSRLISGHMSAHRQLEERIAEWKGTQRALCFSTGYQANIGAITTLVGRGDVVVSDELNHASLIDGCRLSRAQVAVYRHNDVEHLRSVLNEHGSARRKLVVTESVFSMDGDIAPLADISAAAREHGAWLMVDEAHGAGVFGPRGAGVAAELGMTDAIDVHVGTLGKALGSFGAYVAGSSALVDLLINRARSFIFTTGLPPSAAAAACAAIDVIEREPGRAAGLLQRAADLATRLRAAGLSVPCAESQILPIVVGDAGKAVAVMRDLLERGIYVAAIRPPTVPAGTSRLRLSLMATHSADQIDAAADAIIESIAAVTSGERLAAANAARRP